MKRPNAMSADLEQIMAAHNAAEAWARSLKVGDSYTGTLVEARKRYTDLRMQSIFSRTALDLIERKITVIDGVITRCEVALPA